MLADDAMDCGWLKKRRSGATCVANWAYDAAWGYVWASWSSYSGSCVLAVVCTGAIEMDVRENGGACEDRGEGPSGVHTSASAEEGVVAEVVALKRLWEGWQCGSLLLVLRAW